jgi:hypothetical protein
MTTDILKGDLSQGEKRSIVMSRIGYRAAWLGGSPIVGLGAAVLCPASAPIALIGAAGLGLPDLVAASDESEQKCYPPGRLLGLNITYYIR